MTDTKKRSPLESIRGHLVVSCQAYEGEPLRDARAMTLMARSAVLGGAAGIRAQGPADVALIHEAVSVPQIGLWKIAGDDVFITPTLEHALTVARAGAEIVAIDGTRRPRPDDLTLHETIDEIHRQSDALVMADTGSLRDAIAAEAAGADCVGTTLSGYTGEREKTDGPDLELLRDLTATLDIPVLAEGRIHTPKQATAARDAGAFAVVVGTAITHPTTITSWFVNALAASPEG